MAKRKQIDWEAIERERPGLRCLNLGNGEKATIQLLNALLVDKACRDAGVIFEPLGTIKEHQDNNDLVILERLNDKQRQTG